MRHVFSLFCVVLTASSPAGAQDVPESEELDDLFTVPDPASEESDPLPAPASAPSEPDSPEPETLEDDLFAIPELEIEVTLRDPLREVGTISSLSEEDIEAFEYDDPNSFVLRLGGAQVRQEDGFGLRPNIGIRGTSSDRSRKITLMENGVLFGPAPYSAPAAYYFPIMTRMVGVEIIKGPSTLMFGPNTTGGALNLIGRTVPEEAEGGIDFSFGRFWTRRLHAHYGTRDRLGGFVLEAVHLGSDGFKELDAGDGDTGFVRSEFNFVGQLNTDPEAGDYHELRIRLGYSLERSNETYLGLTDGDFEANPNRRYAGSQLDQMNWWRSAIGLTYTAVIGEHVTVTTDLYRHDFDRTWRRLSRFRDGPALSDIVANPTGGREVFYRVLTGESDSASVLDPPQDQQDVMLIDNARRFVSQGVQTRVRIDLETELGGETVLAHHVEVGLRAHYDQVIRDHQENGYRMRSRTLVSDGLDPLIVTDSFSRAFAFSSYLVYGARLGGLTVSPGARVEVINTGFEDFVTATQGDTLRSVFLPGLGVSYEFISGLTGLLGVHRGFSPVGPGQPSEVEAELSVNYEAGARYENSDLGMSAEVVGFFNDFSNLTGECTGSSGCSTGMLDRQFNGGEVRVLGVEMNAGLTADLPDDLTLPLSATYTLTDARFESSFRSENPEFGDVSEGDRVPYIPAHQLRLEAAVTNDHFRISVAGTYLGSMREQAGQGQIEDGELPLTDDYVLLDLVGSVHMSEAVEVYARAQNLLNVAPVVARRPFGARPNHPLSLMLGLKAAL